MYKVSDNIPALTENDCGCFVAFDDQTMISTYVIPFDYDEQGNPNNEDEASLRIMPGMGVIVDPRDGAPG